MKEQPELVDLFAMFIAAGLAANGAEKSKHFAEYAYNLAVEMMWAREVHKGNKDE